MKRELKFRAWDDKRFTWSDEYTEKELPNENLSIFFDDCYGCEIQQFTGLKDKNEVEIYEGDIFILGDFNINYIVEWFDCGLKGRQIGNKSSVGLEYWKEKIEIIGNIYQKNA